MANIVTFLVFRGDRPLDPPLHGHHQWGAGGAGQIISQHVPPFNVQCFKVKIHFSKLFGDFLIKL